MVKRIDAYLRRCMRRVGELPPDVRPTGQREEELTSGGVNVAGIIGEEIRTNPPDGGLVLYTSFEHPAERSAKIIAEVSGMQPSIFFSRELGPMRMSNDFRAKLDAVGWHEDDAVVAYCLDMECGKEYRSNSRVETPGELSDRYRRYVEVTSRYTLRSLPDGHTMRIDYIGHEPGITAVVMDICGIRPSDFNLSFCDGAAKPGDAVHFRMEQNGQDFIIVQMDYRDIQQEYHLPLDERVLRKRPDNDASRI